MPTDGPRTEKQPRSEGRSPAARIRLWPWFIAGYMVVFVGLLFTTAYSLNPNGDAVITCPLWQYYLRELHWAMTSSGDLGPASGSFSAACETAIQHIAFSAAGGAALTGIAWAIRLAKAHRQHGR